jgi:hypothetical protein
VSSKAALSATYKMARFCRPRREEISLSYLYFEECTGIQVRTARSHSEFQIIFLLTLNKIRYGRNIDPQVIGDSMDLFD